MDSYDHRTLGPRLELFHQQEDAPGTAFWHPRGATLYRIIEGYVRGEMRRGGFREVRTPQLVARSLWERSGHWAKFAANMFVFEGGERAFALKPMNCPGHVQVFRHGVRSYRDLPLRLSEFGACHRYEPSGALHGLMRARAFTQDDAHVFCLPERLDAEYVDAEGKRARPWMIHHAVLGSIERFTAVLLEHHRGRLPFWLAPDQVAVAPVAEAHLRYAHEVVDAFETAGLRCVLLPPDESLGRRIVLAHDHGIPVFATVGAKEDASGTVTLREREGARSVLAIADAVSQLRDRDGSDSSAVPRARTERSLDRPPDVH